MIDYKTLESVIQCPVTRENLTYSNNFKAFELFETSTDQNPEEGFINQSNNVFYPVKNNIIILLPEYAITSLNYKTDDNILTVKSFYDRFGWKKTENDKYNDNELFADQKKIADEYVYSTTKRINQFLKPKGTFILDIASGPVYQEEYKEFSKNFDYRICIDISITALEEAQENLKEQNAFFILGDLTNIPLKNESCDNVISMHTLYHIPKDMQKIGVRELVRVCKSNSNVLIAYTWGWHSMLMNVALFPTRVIRLFSRIIKLMLQKSKNASNDSNTGLYFYSHSRNHFIKHKPDNTKIHFSVLRSLHQNFIRLYLSESAWSEKLLAKIFKLEDKYPSFFGKHGAFPIIIIEKLLPTTQGDQLYGYHKEVLL